MNRHYDLLVGDVEELSDFFRSLTLDHVGNSLATNIATSLVSQQIENGR